MRALIFIFIAVLFFLVSVISGSSSTEYCDSITQPPSRGSITCDIDHTDLHETGEGEICNFTESILGQIYYFTDGELTFTSTQTQADVIQLNITIYCSNATGDENISVSIYDDTNAEYDVVSTTVCGAETYIWYNYTICQSGCDLSGQLATDYINSTENIILNFDDVSQVSSEPQDTWSMDYIAVVAIPDDAPQWYGNSTNNSNPATGEDVEHRVRWKDETNLSYYKFEWNATGAGCNSGFDNVTEGRLIGADNWTNITQTISSSCAGKTIAWRVYANDSSGQWNVTNDQSYNVKTPYFEVILNDPAASTIVGQNTTFLINATVTCRDGICGNVSGASRYNNTGADPDTNISTTSGDTPFYITDNPNPGNCSGNPLVKDESCTLAWTVNATGNIGTSYKTGVLFSSNESYVQDNHTTNSTVSIVECAFSTTIWSSVNFGALNPGASQQAASGNDGGKYNITIDATTTCNADLWIKGEDMNSSSGNYKIGVGNTTWSTTNLYSGSASLTENYASVATNAAPDTNTTTYYWINVPYGIESGAYQGNVTILTNKTSS